MKLALALLTLSMAASLSAHDRNRNFRATKECSQFTGAPGGFCTFTSSTLPLIKVGTKIYYDQAPGVPAGLLDSNVILDAGSGNRAIGRCTLDLTTGNGLCTFGDGTGVFSGFEARIKVTYTGGPNYLWEGTYGFDKNDL